MKRKAIFVIGVLAALVAALVATSVSTAAPAGAFKVDLFAGKTTDVGDVYVWNDANAYIEIDMASGWCMTESHVAVATSLAGIPQTSKGNPIPGQFPQGDDYDPCADGDTFTFSLASLGAVAGQPLIIAVHAEVWGALSSLDVYSDAGKATVISSPAGVTPRPAVDAWEAFGDPVDPTPSTWDTGVGVGTFALADWIWSDYRVNTPTVDETATFRHTFAVPGLPAPGSWMKVTTDDAFTAALNGSQVASGAWPNWPTVQNASPFAPVKGANTLLFAATNSALSYGIGGTIDNNPGGLIYEARVNYYAQNESAWAGTGVGTIQFPGKNWATYFTYTPVLPTVRVANNPQVDEGGVLGYQVELSFAPWLTTTVAIETVAGFSTAQPPGDYTTNSQTLTFVPGDSTETFSVQTNQDGLYEPATTLGPGEYVWTHITSGTNVTLPPDFAGNLALTDLWGLGFIVDDDPIAGDIWMGDNAPGGVPDQHLTFSLDDSPDSGTYGYVNVDGAVDYSGAPSCVDFDSATPNVLRFAYQIPPGEGGLSGLWIVWRVTGGATPTAGFSVAIDGTDATAKCESSSFTPSNSYPVYSGSVNF